jgi:hypothetical protein
MRPWRAARIVAFDAETGWHSVQYASGLKRSGERLELRLNDTAELELLRFDEKETRLMLAAREYCIVCRDSFVDETEIKSPFDMERLLTAGIVPEAEDEVIRSSPRPSIGTRVDSNCASSDWQPYTVVAIDQDESSSQDENLRFVLVSDSGEVHCGVRPSQIRGLALNESSDDEGSSSDRAGRSFAEGRVRDNRGQSNRTFPFLTARRQSSDNTRSISGAVRTFPGVGVLKRSWSALAPIESMCPVELNLSEDPLPTFQQDRVPVGCLAWRCSLSDRDIDIFAEHAVVELPPQLRVKFSSQENHTATEVASPNETTLISLLWQINQPDGRHISFEQPHDLFYTVNCEWKRPFDKAPQTLEFASSVPGKIISPAFENAALANRPQGAGMTHDAAQRDSGSLLNPENRSRKLRNLASYLSDEEGTYRGLCEGLDEICVQCMEIIGLLCEISENPAEPKERKDWSIFENQILSRKLTEQLDDPLVVVGGALPEWCVIAPSFAPQVFSYKSRNLLLERAAFGISRSTLRQQESKVDVARLRQRMSSLRARAVELVGEAFSGGAEDPTALQLQADELYGMEEALAARVKAAFRAERWEEHSLQVAKAAVHRDLLISDAATVMHRYANDDRFCRRRLEVRFDGESGFDAAAGDEAGVTRGFYADVAEALLSCDSVAGVNCTPVCADVTVASLDRVVPVPVQAHGLPCRLPLWIPDVDASGQVTIPTPRADPRSGLGVYPRPLSSEHPLAEDVLVHFRFMGRLFAAALRDGFMFPLPLSSAFLKLVQHGSDLAGFSIQDRELLLTTCDLPRPGFLGGEVFAVDAHVCCALDRLDELDPPLTRADLERRYREIATDKNFARVALGKSYDCSFEDYFQDRTFVDPLDPTQGIEAAPLCPNGYRKSVTIYNIREWAALAKDFFLHDGVIAQALAFRHGVEDFFPADYLRLFTPEELQSDVCGVGDNVDNWDEAAVRKLFKLDGGKGAAEALVAVAAIGGEGGAALSRRFGPSSPTINFVVKALLAATPKLRRQFLSFVTSVPIVTPGQIEVVPIVSPGGEFIPMRDPGCLPRANTCARRLYLPKFESYESFCQVIWAVVGEESKFKGFYEWRGN